MQIRRVSILVAWLVVGCAGPRLTPATLPATPGATSPTPAATTATATAVRDGPPAARVAAEGGDPVVGQLGTYVWRDGGSDSPWLPGARIAVGAGEPLTVTLDPTVGITSWSARSVPATADGPAGATVLGEGSGAPVFSAPAPGAWTVEVRVGFADEAGSASYFWRLEIS